MILVKVIFNESIDANTTTDDINNAAMEDHNDWIWKQTDAPQVSLPVRCLFFIFFIFRQNSGGTRYLCEGSKATELVLS